MLRTSDKVVLHHAAEYESYRLWELANHGYRAQSSPHFADFGVA
jgi:hypothetical protein